MYLLLAFTYLWIAWHIPPLLPFSTINNTSISIEKSNFTLISFNAACYANPGAVRNEQAWFYIFWDLYFNSCQAPHPTIMYHFEHTYHDILLNVLFQNLYKLLLCGCSLHQQCLPCLNDCKKIIFQVMKFHWTFVNHTYIHMGRHFFTARRHAY